MTAEERRLRAEQRAATRFQSHVDCSAGPTACWNWQSYTDSNGYAITRWPGHRNHVRAGYVALKLAGRPRPAGLIMLHSCDNPLCVNPDHLSWGTAGDNMQQMAQRGRGRRAVLTAADKAEIRYLMSNCLAKSPELARRFNVSASQIRHIGKSSDQQLTFFVLGAA